MAGVDFKTGRDLLFYALKNAGQSEATTDQYATDAKEAILAGYWTILASEQYPWAKAAQPKVISTVSKVTGTVSSISAADPAVVTLSDTIATSMALRKFYLDSNQSLYRIASHTAGTKTLTLDARWVETDSSGSFTIYQDEYVLASDVILPWNPLRLRGQYPGEVNLIDLTEFEARFSMQASQVGLTSAATILRYSFNNEDMAPTIQIAPWTEDGINLEYEYSQRHVLTFDGATDGTDTPRVPREFRWILGDWGRWGVLLNKNDPRAAVVGQAAIAGLGELKNKFRSSQSKSRNWQRPRFGLGVR